MESGDQKYFHILNLLEMFYLNSTLNFGIPPVLVFQLDVYYKVDRLLSGLTAQTKGTTARWYSNKTSLIDLMELLKYFLKKCSSWNAKQTLESGSKIKECWQ